MVEKKQSSGTQIKVGNITSSGGVINIAGRDIKQTIINTKSGRPGNPGF